MRRLLLLIGLVLCVPSLFMLMRTGELFQYTLPAPSAENVIKLADSKRELENELKELGTASLGLYTDQISVSYGAKSETAMLFAVGEGWFETDPVYLKEGRRLTETELASTEKLALIDSELAFSFFGAEIPENAGIRLEGKDYRIVGTIRHQRGVGDTAEHVVYVPLRSAVEIPSKVLQMNLYPTAGSGAATVAEDVLRIRWADGGNFYRLQKEALRQTLSARLTGCVLCLALLLRMLNRLNRFTERRIGAYRSRLRGEYFEKTLLDLFLLIVTSIFLYAVWIGVMYVLFRFAAEPLYTFTEWIPENFVELSSLKKVFWNLNTEAARPIRIATRELRSIEFWGGCTTWGVLCLLVGGLLRNSQKR